MIRSQAEKTLLVNCGKVGCETKLILRGYYYYQGGVIIDSEYFFKNFGNETDY